MAARVVLNYKNIPYETKFVEYPDLEATLSGLGLPPNEEGTAFAPYSSPTIRLPDGTMVMNSANIIPKLEAKYPKPSLYLETGLHKEAEKLITDLGLATWWDGMVTTKDELLPPRSSEYFARTRKEVFGASLEDCAAAKGGETAWKNAVEPIKKLAAFMKEHRKKGEEDGPFVLGNEPSYADFMIVTMFECYERCHDESYQKVVVEGDLSFKALHEACRPWLKRDD